MPLAVIRQLPGHHPVLHSLYKEPSSEECEADLKEKATSGVEAFIRQFPEFQSADFYYQYYREGELY